MRGRLGYYSFWLVGGIGACFIMGSFLPLLVVAISILALEWTLAWISRW